jgi:hypothetical protein
MPKLSQIITIQLSDIEGVHQETKNSLMEIGAINITESFADNSKELEGFVPSIWGWGGMNIGVKLRKNNDFIELDITGYIAQLATSPLTKNMNALVNLLASKLKARYNYDLDLSKTKPSNTQITQVDKKVFVMIVVSVLIVTFLGAIFGNAAEMILWLSLLGIAYYLGKKYIYK